MLYNIHRELEAHKSEKGNSWAKPNYLQSMRYLKCFSMFKNKHAQNTVWNARRISAVSVSSLNQWDNWYIPTDPLSSVLNSSVKKILGITLTYWPHTNTDTIMASRISFSQLLAILSMNTPTFSNQTHLITSVPWFQHYYCSATCSSSTLLHKWLIIGCIWIFYHPILALNLWFHVLLRSFAQACCNFLVPITSLDGPCPLTQASESKLTVWHTFPHWNIH